MAHITMFKIGACLLLVPLAASQYIQPGGLNEVNPLFNPEVAQQLSPPLLDVAQKFTPVIDPEVAQQLSPSLLAGTIANHALLYWSTNNCAYPPKDFYAMFREACDVVIDDASFVSGICRAYFNSTKSICHLEKGGEDEIQTMNSISSMQATMENDAICDTLSQMREGDPSLFPKPIGDNQWFGAIYNIIFSENCKDACSLKHVHPICFGYLLNYDYFESLRMQDSDEETVVESNVPTQSVPTEEQVELTTSANEVAQQAIDDNVSEPILSDLEANDVNKDIEGPTPFSFGNIVIFNTNQSNVYKPNPKLLNTRPSNPEDYYYGFFDGASEGEVSDVENNEQSNEDKPLLDDGDLTIDDIMEINEETIEAMMDDNEKIGSSSTDTDKVGRTFSMYDDDFEIPNEERVVNEEELKEDANKANGKNPADDYEYYNSSMFIDRSDQLPMLSIIILLSGVFVVLSIFALYRARRRSSVRRARPAGRFGQQWNYERVLTITPDADDNYYE